MNKYIRNLIILIVFQSLLGCGYTTSSTLPSNIKTIHIELFENKINYASAGERNIYLPLLEVKARNAIIDRFQYNGALKNTEPENADLILKGYLKSYDRRGLRYTDNDDVQEYRVYITVHIELYNTQTQETDWVEDSFTGEATYFTTGSQATSEETAVAEAITDLARRIVERTVEDW